MCNWSFVDFLFLIRFFFFLVRLFKSICLIKSQKNKKQNRIKIMIYIDRFRRKNCEREKNYYYLITKVKWKWFNHYIFSSIRLIIKQRDGNVCRKKLSWNYIWLLITYYNNSHQWTNWCLFTIKSISLKESSCNSIFFSFFFFFDLLLFCFCFISFIVD